MMASDPPFTTGDFHNVVQKEIAAAVGDMLASSKFDWDLIVPFLDTARDLVVSDFRHGNARIRIHGVRADGDQVVEAEEAYLAIGVVDPDDGTEWMSETWWLSDILRADNDPDQVRIAMNAMGRTMAKLNAWLAEVEAAKAAPQEE
jgi:hypothetical protein